jgi:hypothetical protein
MTTLVMALYAEGHSDERFLPIVIQRTAEQILARRGRTTVDVLEPMVLNHRIDRDHPTRVERMLEAARRAAGYHTLIVHQDADHPTPARALNDRYAPGRDRVDAALAGRQRVCEKLVPITPVRMTEAWMLADPEALRIVIGTRLEAADLGLPAHPHEVESDAHPKQTFQTALHRALADRPRRRQNIDISTVYEPLARQISLARLNLVPAYSQFVEELSHTLVALHFAI